MAITPYPAPDVILPNETGDIIDIKDFRPNMVVLFFTQEIIPLAVQERLRTLLRIQSFLTTLT